jgi:rhodanese-related sulfurtransferase
MKTLLRIAALGALALIAGFLVNQIHPEGIHRNMMASALSVKHRWRRITADSAKVLLVKNAAVFVDIRDEKEFRKERIPGAESQPFYPFFKRFTKFEREHPKDRTYVFYCFEPACREGRMMLVWMQTRGYTKAVWMYGGLSQWIQGGYPAEGGK